MKSLLRGQDIPKIDDKDFSVTLNAFFVVRWKDSRLVIDQDRIDEILGPENESSSQRPEVQCSAILEIQIKSVRVTMIFPFAHAPEPLLTSDLCFIRY